MTLMARLRRRRQRKLIALRLDAYKQARARYVADRKAAEQ